MSTSAYLKTYHKHLHRYFANTTSSSHVLTESPLNDRLPQFHVVEIAPGKMSQSWVYVSAGLGAAVSADRSCEFLLCSAVAEPDNIKLLHMLAWHHVSVAAVGAGHLLKIGHPWIKESALNCLLITRLWQFGEKLEMVRTRAHHTRIHWVLPITEDEHAYAVVHGFQALEQLFEDRQIHYADATRDSMLRNMEAKAI